MQQQKPTPILVMGIISIVLSWSCLSIVSIVLGAINIGKANAWTGEFSNQVAIGKRLSIAGLIIGCVCTLIWLFVLIGIIVNS